jgi:CO/xanthine dehydrogenase Mo-binding subunit
MAKHTGRGIAAIEYPTGMNQNGDPSQCWIKVKPDGRVDVFAGTADIGNGSKGIQSQIVAETIGVPYDWITYDNSNTDSSPVCTGTFASRATFVAGKAAEKAALKVREQILEIAGKELEIDPATSRSSTATWSPKGHRRSGSPCPTSPLRRPGATAS